MKEEEPNDKHSYSYTSDQNKISKKILDEDINYTRQNSDKPKTRKIKKEEKEDINIKKKKNKNKS